MKRTQWCGVLLLLMCCTGVAAAQTDSGEYYALLFSSNGCSSCGDADMFVFTELTTSYPELVVVDYELSAHSINNVVYQEFLEAYGAEKRVPMFILGQNLVFTGRSKILDNITPILDAQHNGDFADTTSLLPFETLSLSDLDGYPKIWRANRVLIFEEEGGDEVFLKKLIDTPDINTTLSGRQFETISPPPVRVGKQELTFDHAVRVEGWVLQWNDVEMPVEAKTSFATPVPVWGAFSALVAVAAAGMRKQVR